MSKEILYEFMHSGGLTSIEDESNESKIATGMHLLQDVKNKKISPDKAKEIFTSFIEEPEAA